MKILVCAATSSEARACRRAFSDEPAIKVLQVGVGPHHAARRLWGYLASHPKPMLIVSCGFAGAVTRDLFIGDWVTSSHIIELKYPDRMLSLASAAKTLDFESVRPVTLVSSARLFEKEHAPMLIASVKKLELADKMASISIAVDMESSALARIAKENQISFSVLRMISDTPDKHLPEFVASFANAMSDNRWFVRLQYGAQGILGALKDLPGVQKLLRNGSKWSQQIETDLKNFRAALMKII